MEQLDFFSVNLTEQSVYNILLDSLRSVVSQNNLNMDNLLLKEGKSYSSVWFDTQMIFRICCRNTKHYFGISDSLAVIADQMLPDTISRSSSNDGFTNFQFDFTVDGVLFFEECLTKILDTAIDSIPKQFDCCSRFEECSDAKRCTNPNPELALVCGYRKIMKQGRIFFGKDRNVK